MQQRSPCSMGTARACSAGCLSRASQRSLPVWSCFPSRSCQPQRMRLLSPARDLLEAPPKPSLLQRQESHTHRLASGGEEAPSDEHPLPALVSCSPSACFQEEHAELHTTASCCGKAELHPYIWLQWRWEGKRLSLSPVAQEKHFQSTKPTAFTLAASAFLSLLQKNVLSFFSWHFFHPPPLTKMRDSKLNSQRQISQRAHCFVVTPERATENSVWYSF